MLGLVLSVVNEPEYFQAYVKVLSHHQPKVFTSAFCGSLPQSSIETALDTINQKKGAGPDLKKNSSPPSSLCFNEKGKWRANTTFI